MRADEQLKESKNSKTEFELFTDLEKPSLSKPVDQLPEMTIAKGEITTFIVRPTINRVRKKAERAIAPAPVLVPMENLRFVSDSKERKVVELQLQGFYLAGIDVKKSSYQNKAPGFVEDIAVPNDILFKKTFHLPPESISTRPSYLIEIVAPRQSGAGPFSGHVEFRLGRELYQIPLSGEVSSLELPDKFALKTSFGFSPSAVIKKHTGGWSDKALDIYQEYLSLALEHRIDLHKIYLQFPAVLPNVLAAREQVDRIDLLGHAKVPAQSFSAIWNQLKKTSLGRRFSTTDVPVPEEMKKATGTPEHVQAAKEFWRALDRSVVKQRGDDLFFVYFADEPKKDQLGALKQNLLDIHKWAPDVPILVTTNYSAALAGLIQIWCVNLINWDVPEEVPTRVYDERRKTSGEQVWLYTSCNAHGCTGAEDHHIPDLVVDRPTAFQRVFPWVAWRYRAEGILYYDTVYGYSLPDAKSPWKDSFSFTGVGEGNLFYPCTRALCGESIALASLRLKILRQGLQDVQILEMAARAGVPTHQWVQNLIPNSHQFPLASNEFEKLKSRALKSLISGVGK